MATHFMVGAVKRASSSSSFFLTPLLQEITGKEIFKSLDYAKSKFLRTYVQCVVVYISF